MVGFSLLRNVSFLFYVSVGNFHLLHKDAGPRVGFFTDVLYTNPMPDIFVEIELSPGFTGSAHPLASPIVLLPWDFGHWFNWPERPIQPTVLLDIGSPNLFVSWPFL